MPDGTVKTVLMNVTIDDVFGNRTLCYNVITSSSGTLSCFANATIDQSQLVTNIYVDGDLISKQYINVNTGNGYGSIGFVIWFIISLILIFIFDDDKSALLLCIGLSSIVSIGLGLVNGTIIGYGASGLSILIVVVIGLYKLNKGRVQ